MKGNAYARGTNRPTAGPDPIQCSPMAAGPQPAPGALDALASQARGLHALADVLEERLSRVLRPSPPRDAAPPAGQGAHIRDVELILSYGLSRLDEIAARIDL